MTEDWNLAEIPYSRVREQHYEVALLPLGATEPHNLHLPYGTDTFQANLIGRKSCAEAWSRGARVVLLPTVPYGTQTNMREFPLAMNVYPSTLTTVISDLVESVSLAGIRKIVLLNSHGGNSLKSTLRELAGKFPVHLFLCDWYTMISDVCRDVLEHPDDHAGEMETSIALAWFGELVARDSGGALLADEGKKRPFRFEALERGWVNISRPWHLLTTNSGAGYPHKATAEKGEQIMAVVVERLASFLTELSAAEVDASFPFQP